MGISKRKSDEYLHTDVILSKISEYDIFRYYCTNFKEINKKFCSELRRDKNPTVSIVKWNEKLLYKDFAVNEHTFNCFSYVAHKYTLTFLETLTVIDTDFNLGLSSKNKAITLTRGYIGYTYNKKIVDKKLIIIKKRTRTWAIQDANFWKKYNIGKKILSIFDVTPIDYYWINCDRFRCEKITYAFKIGNKYKIYAPYSEVKWTSNTTKDHVQGYEQLPKTDEILLLTSSLKDVMALYSLGYNAIALQSEMQIPKEKLINKLQKRFKKIFVLYDNDYTKPDNPGQNMAEKICNKYNITNIKIPSRYKSKDISDLIKNFNISLTKSFLNREIWQKNIKKHDLKLKMQKK